MILTLKRIYTCKDYNSNGVKSSGYTIGHLYVDGSYICDTLEDTDRMLDSSMSLDQIAKIKVKGMTAIPTGRYKVLMNIVSPKYSKSKYYMNICKGRVPRLDNVPGYSGVLIHVGNTAADTEGCLLLGYNKVKGQVISSKVAFEKVYNKLSIAKSIGQTIYIDIERKY